MDSDIKVLLFGTKTKLRMIGYHFHQQHVIILVSVVNSAEISSVQNCNVPIQPWKFTIPEVATTQQGSYTYLEAVFPNFF